MKNAKRILTLLLAVIMVANVFAVSAFAADAGLTVSFSAPETVEAGSSFTVTVNMKSSADSAKWGGGSLAVSYNSAYVSTSKANLSVLSAWSSIITVPDNYTFSNSMQAGAVTATEKANYGWDSYKVFGFANATGGACTDLTAGADTLAITFDVAEGLADGTEIYIGIPTEAVEGEAYELALYSDAAGCEKFGNIDDNFENYEYNYNVDAALVKVTVGSAAAAPEVVCAGTMARMDKWEEADTTNEFDGGLMGQINNLPLEFDGKECTTIKSIEVFLNGEEEASANAYQVYKVNDTTYKFRAVITGMNKTNANYATDFTYKFVVTLSDDTTLEVEGTTSAKAIYETAKAHYDEVNAQ